MRHFAKLVLSLGVLALLAGPASAQERKERGGADRGPALGMLLTNKSVQEELHLTSEQRDELRKRAEEARDKYRDQLAGTPHHFHLAPGFIARAGAVVVVALLLVPLAGLAARRRWAALVLGGSLSWTLLLAIPGFAWLLLNGALAGLFLGVICARFRDLPQIVSNIVQIAFFISPVMWKSGATPRMTSP